MDHNGLTNKQTALEANCKGLNKTHVDHTGLAPAVTRDSSRVQSNLKEQFDILEILPFYFLAELHDKTDTTLIYVL